MRDPCQCSSKGKESTLSSEDDRLYKIMLTETEEGLTENELASCTRHYREGMDKFDEAVIFSEGCTYQNSNSLLSNVLQRFANSTGTSIQHKYLVRGHTNMEVDREPQSN
ncbi:hypothetical protein PoB_003188700 [Plakobranchus ocellatus]|uniref:Uncharacterized protein n=1 Tax=Plakobranchus ocellatus TaxID=259542 RepID=A0AAV4AER4_9GAST|nr:hypothetical protein PoB_003188700 [Plakobranchus ocellatus]